MRPHSFAWKRVEDSMAQAWFPDSMQRDRHLPPRSFCIWLARTPGIADLAVLPKAGEAPGSIFQIIPHGECPDPRLYAPRQQHTVIERCSKYARAQHKIEIKKRRISSSEHVCLIIAPSGKLLSSLLVSSSENKRQSKHSSTER